MWMVSHPIKEFAVSVDVLPGALLLRLKPVDLGRREWSIRGGLKSRSDMVHYPGRWMLLEDVGRWLWSLDFFRDLITCKSAEFQSSSQTYVLPKTLGRRTFILFGNKQVSMERFGENVGMWCFRGTCCMNRLHTASTGHISDTGPRGWHQAVKQSALQ